MARLIMYRDLETEMVRIDLDGSCLFEGNFWDFDLEKFRKIARALEISLVYTEESYTYS